MTTGWAPRPEGLKSTDARANVKTPKEKIAFLFLRDQAINIALGVEQYGETFYTTLFSENVLSRSDYQGNPSLVSSLIADLESAVRKRGPRDVAASCNLYEFGAYPTGILRENADLKALLGKFRKLNYLIRAAIVFDNYRQASHFACKLYGTAYPPGNGYSNSNLKGAYANFRLAGEQAATRLSSWVNRLGRYNTWFVSSDRLGKKIGEDILKTAGNIHDIIGMPGDNDYSVLPQRPILRILVGVDKIKDAMANISRRRKGPVSFIRSRHAGPSL